MTLRSGPFFGPRGSIDWSDGKPMQIIVRDNNVDQALRALKKKLQREGVYREMKLRRHYEKPSEKRSEEHTSELQLLMRISYALFCLNTKIVIHINTLTSTTL